MIFRWLKAWWQRRRERWLKKNGLDEPEKLVSYAACQVGVVKHRWKEEQYGLRCQECGEFIPYGEKAR